MSGGPIAGDARGCTRTLARHRSLTGVGYLAFDADDRLLVAGITQEAVLVREYVDTTPGWQWSADQPRYISTGLAPDGDVIVGAAWEGDADLGGGSLPSRGERDLVLVHLNR